LQIWSAVHLPDGQFDVSMHASYV